MAKCPSHGGEVDVALDDDKVTRKYRCLIRENHFFYEDIVTGKTRLEP
jgi:hypothetical protein